ncbi:MAG TPA: hypothetical protein VEA18_00445, partial [Candidatus Kapabacteria bacterium]|nr:hypothetical protein [Candidatus Kapabacteria bacterium]
KNYSEKTAELIDEEISNILAQAKKRAEEILTERRKEMDALVKALLEKETVEQEEFIRVVGKGPRHVESASSEGSMEGEQGKVETV